MQQSLRPDDIEKINPDLLREFQLLDVWQEDDERNDETARSKIYVGANSNTCSMYGLGDGERVKESPRERLFIFLKLRAIALAGRDKLGISATCKALAKVTGGTTVLHPHDDRSIFMRAISGDVLSPPEFVQLMRNMQMEKVHLQTIFRFMYSLRHNTYDGVVKCFAWMSIPIELCGVNEEEMMWYHVSVRAEWTKQWLRAQQEKMRWQRMQQNCRDDDEQTWSYRGDDDDDYDEPVDVGTGGFSQEWSWEEYDWEGGGTSYSGAGNGRKDYSHAQPEEECEEEACPPASPPTDPRDPNDYQSTPPPPPRWKNPPPPPTRKPPPPPPRGKPSGRTLFAEQGGNRTGQLVLAAPFAAENGVHKQAAKGLHLLLNNLELRGKDHYEKAVAIMCGPGMRGVTNLANQVGIIWIRKFT